MTVCAYKGVKFKVVFLGGSPPDDPMLEELKHWCGEFSRHGLAPRCKGGSCGNLSFRINKNSNAFVITASGTRLSGRAGRDSFVMVPGVDFKERIVYAYGAKEPSSESMLHSAIYKKRKDVNAVFHGHCQRILSTAASKGISETKKEEPYGTSALVKRVMDVLGRKKFIVMKGHGFLSLGRTMEDAGGNTFKIYRACFKELSKRKRSI